MTSEHIFGYGRGWLPRKAERIAGKHNAVLVNHSQAQCECGYGCNPYTCKASRVHWFAGPQRGDPGNQQLAVAVIADLRAAGIIDKEKDDAETTARQARQRDRGHT